jgi:GT2 family glycosyltransferase
MNAAIILASAGRPTLLGAAIANVDRLRGENLTKVVSVPDQPSLPAGHDLAGWQVVVGTRGLAAQRNAGLDVLSGSPVVFFFDDDAVVREDYVVNALAFLAAHPDVAGLTGQVLLDGATRGEVPAETADRALSDSWSSTSDSWRPTRELYGCNFAVRMSAAPRLRFDPRLPLYSWLEDHDFARRLMRFGRLAEVDSCVIVHRGAASGGRTAHVRLGYSQVMNPVHLWRKGSFPGWLAAYEIFRPTAKNVARSLRGGDSSWRRERLRGNRLAVADALRGRITPERILHL